MKLFFSVFFALTLTFLSCQTPADQKIMQSAPTCRIFHRRTVPFVQSDFYLFQTELVEKNRNTPCTI